jgi:hypothetical protein
VWGKEFSSEARVVAKMAKMAKSENLRTFYFSKTIYSFTLHRKHSGLEMIHPQFGHFLRTAVTG